MRPIEAGLSDKDVAAVLRVRRRVAVEGRNTLPSKEQLRIFQLCDDLHVALNKIVTKKAVASADSSSESVESDFKPRKTRRKATS